MTRAGGCAHWQKIFNRCAIRTGISRNPNKGGGGYGSKTAGVDLGARCCVRWRLGETIKLANTTGHAVGFSTTVYWYNSPVAFQIPKMRYSRFVAYLVRPVGGTVRLC